MKWFASYWGIDISAESEDDDALLKKLAEALPPRADAYYEIDGGKLVIGDRPQREFVVHSGFTITFYR